MNRHIRVPEVRLIDEQGEMLGVLTTDEAIKRAQSAGLDLVEVSPNADPPVCKIIDYGKFKYTQQKKANEARKKQKVIAIKEVKLRPTIDPHDLGIKLRHAREFIAEGDKVKFILKFRGREMSHQDIGMQLLRRVRADLADIVKVDQEPSFEGRQVVMMVSPVK